MRGRSPSPLVILTLNPSLLVILTLNPSLLVILSVAKNLILLRTGSVKGKNLLFSSFLSSGLRASAHQGKLRKATS